MRGVALPLCSVCGLLAMVLAAPSAPLAAAPSASAPALVVQPIDEHLLVRLAGNTRPEARLANDRGRVADSLRLEHLQLVLKPSPARAEALRKLLSAQQEPGSPQYHRWLSAAQFGARFGLAPADLDAISGWLTGHGFTVNRVYPNGLGIDFSGTAAQVAEVLHCEIHTYESAGTTHIANQSDPEIPAAFGAVIEGVASLTDFRPHANFRLRTAAAAHGNYTVSGSQPLVAPADLATIYGLSPLFASGTSGQGQTIVVIEDSDPYSPTRAADYSANWATFRTAFGLAAAYPEGSLTVEHPDGCTDPGTVKGDEAEATLDAQWASAAAPSAAIVVASCKSTLTFGGYIALANLVNSASPPAIMSLSYGECEAENGAANNAAFNELYEQAAALGSSMFVSAGDDGAASCDEGAAATHGIGVSAFASSPYVVAVGGTDFGDTYAGTTSTYWSSTNSTTYGSALSYVAEIPWNDSCASALTASYAGFATGYGADGYCNSSSGADDLTTTAGSGGPSGCATGSPSTAGVVGGTCAGYAKPSWQALVSGNPADGVRDIPDVALFASNGAWGHYYVYCDTDPNDSDNLSSDSCSGAPSTWAGAGGTSFASPILAGVQALINQTVGSSQGNPNPTYYRLAAIQSASGLNCNSTSRNGPAAGCVFYDVTLGDMDIDCTGSNSCYGATPLYGALSTTSSAFAPAYAAATGWDFATGLGSINAQNLVTYWTSADLSLSVTGTTSASGFSYTVKVANSGPDAATSVTVTVSVPSGLALAAGSSSGCSQTGQTVSCALGSLAAGGSSTVSIDLAGSVGSVTLSFAAAAKNADLDPADNAASLTLAASSVPLPAWAPPALAALLLMVAARGSRRAARRPTRS